VQAFNFFYYYEHAFYDIVTYWRYFADSGHLRNELVKNQAQYHRLPAFSEALVMQASLQAC
jgi:hypothetical protein